MPSLVVNAAAYNFVDRAEAEPDAAMAVNAKGPGIIATTCASLGVPLIHVSTDYVFDGEKQEPYVGGRSGRAARGLWAEQGERRRRCPASLCRAPDHPHGVALRRLRFQLPQDHAPSDSRTG